MLDDQNTVKWQPFWGVLVLKNEGKQCFVCDLSFVGHLQYSRRVHRDRVDRMDFAKIMCSKSNLRITEYLSFEQYCYTVRSCRNATFGTCSIQFERFMLARSYNIINFNLSISSVMAGYAVTECASLIHMHSSTFHMLAPCWIYGMLEYCTTKSLLLC